MFWWNKWRMKKSDWERPRLWITICRQKTHNLSIFQIWENFEPHWHRLLSENWHDFKLRGALSWRANKRFGCDVVFSVTFQKKLLPSKRFVTFIGNTSRSSRTPLTQPTGDKIQIDELFRADGWLDDLKHKQPIRREIWTLRIQSNDG